MLIPQAPDRERRLTEAAADDSLVWQAGRDDGRQHLELACLTGAGTHRQKGRPLRALRLYGIEDARVVDVPDPVLKEPTDAIVRVTRSGLCGTDVMFYREMPALYLG